MAESSRDEIAKLEALYANNPEGRVFTHLAEAYRKAGELDRARTILEDGLAKHPAYASAHVVLGRVLLDQHRGDEAADAFRRVITLDPHNHVALRSLGDLARVSGRRDEALHYFGELRQLDPTDDEITNILADLESTPDPVPLPEPDQPEPEPGSFDAAPANLGPFDQAPAPETSEQDIDWLSDAADKPNVGFGDLGELPGFEAGQASAYQEGGQLGDLGALDVNLGAQQPPAEEEAQPIEDFVLDTPATTPPAQHASQVGTFDNSEATAPAGEVLTETIADLYRSQGLYERAADVYRALLAQRPGDGGLEAKLQEVEARARAPYERLAAEPKADHVSEPEAVHTGAVDEDAEAWLAGGSAAAESAPTPYAWRDTAAPEVEGGPPIREYFRRLLSWQKRANGGAQIEPDRVFEASSEPMMLLDEQVVVTESYFEMSEPAPSETPAPAAWEPEPWESAAPATETPSWEAPASLQDSPPPAAPSSPPMNQPDSTADNAGDAFDEWFGDADKPAEQPPSTPAGTREDEQAEDDDDDLEMFRSWLQSLKK